jgi:hypothetical protein
LAGQNWEAHGGIGDDRALQTVTRLFKRDSITFNRWSHRHNNAVESLITDEKIAAVPENNQWDVISDDISEADELRRVVCMNEHPRMPTDAIRRE